MITHRIGDIFEQKDLNGIAVQCNTYGIFGAGINKQVKALYPSAAAESKAHCDLENLKGRSTLGSFDVVCPRANFFIFNIYSQEGMGGGVRNTRYDVLADVLEKVKESIEYMELNYVFKLGIPFGYGAGKGGGSWIIIEAIFRSVFSDCKFIELVIVENSKFSIGVKK